jgi:hypothetical protein
VLGISWFNLTWNTTVGELIPALRFRTKATIAGIVEEATPTLSLNAVLTGTYQQRISLRIGKVSPMFKPGIRWKNQIYYTLLGTAGSERVVVGSQRQLLDLSYLVEYCGRDLEVLRTTGEAWAARIRQMQDFFEDHGMLFLYVITPSKVAQYPQIIPDGYTCPAGASDRTNKLKLYDEILTRHGVRFVDTASYLTAVSKDYPISMFPRGGTHWNELAAALGTQALIAAVNAQRRGSILAELRFTWRVSYNPRGLDRDMMDMLNLPFPDAHYAVPELTYPSSAEAAGCHAIRITEVSGSFIFGINDALQKLACPPEISHWFYWNWNLLHHANDHRDVLPIDAQARRQSLLDADVVILEENEASGPHSGHGELMMREMATLTQTAAASATTPAASPPPQPR